MAAVAFIPVSARTEVRGEAPQGGDAEGSPRKRPAAPISPSRRPRGSRARPCPQSRSHVSGFHRQPAAVGAAPRPVGLQAPAKEGGQIAGGFAALAASAVCGV